MRIIVIVLIALLSASSSNTFFSQAAQNKVVEHHQQESKVEFEGVSVDGHKGTKPRSNRKQDQGTTRRSFNLRAGEAHSKDEGINSSVHTLTNVTKEEEEQMEEGNTAVVGREEVMEPVKGVAVKQQRRMVACYNLANFRDSHGRTCRNEYRRYSYYYCPRAHWYTNSHGQHARQGCCACGGGCVDKLVGEPTGYKVYWQDKFRRGCEWYTSSYRCSLAETYASSDGSAKDYCCMCYGGNWRNW